MNSKEFVRNNLHSALVSASDELSSIEMAEEILKVFRPRDVLDALSLLRRGKIPFEDQIDRAVEKLYER